MSEQPTSQGDQRRRKGRCLCGAVRYEVRGELRPVVNCHCYRCRRATGHFMAATAAVASRLELLTEGTLRWYEPGDTVQYGFCVTCGSTLFWRALSHPEEVSIAAGTLEPPTGLETTEALFVAEASDYHRLDHDLVEHAHDWRQR